MTSGAARVLLYDLETSPNIGYTWGAHEQSVIRFVKERMVICFAYKWLHEKKTYVHALPDFKGYRSNPDDNTALVRKLHSVMSGADILVAHNGVSFDNPMASSDFIKAGLDPLPQQQTIDTLRFARSKFRFNHNRLDDLGRTLGVGRKIRHEGFDMWLKCLAGDKKAWERMKAYNRQDVMLLERVYYKLRPWMNRHPDLTNWSRRIACPKCESSDCERRGWSYTQASRRRRYVCRKCRSWFYGHRQKDIKH